MRLLIGGALVALLLAFCSGQANAEAERPEWCDNPPLAVGYLWPESRGWCWDPQVVIHAPSHWSHWERVDGVMAVANTLHRFAVDFDMRPSSPLIWRYSDNCNGMEGYAIPKWENPQFDATEVCITAPHGFIPSGVVPRGWFQALQFEARWFNQCDPRGELRDGMAFYLAGDKRHPAAVEFAEFLETFDISLTYAVRFWHDQRHRPSCERAMFYHFIWDRPRE